MKVSKYRMEKIIELQNKAFNLYKEGTLNTRQIGGIIGKSHSWVAKAIIEVEKRKELSTLKVDKKRQTRDNKSIKNKE